MNRSYLGCDYSTRTVTLACSRTDPLGNALSVYSVDMKPSLEDACTELRYILEAAATRHGIGTLYIEKPWGASNWVTTQRLVRVATVVEVVAVVMAGLDVKWVHPGTWRRVVYGKGSGLRKNTYKELAVARAREIWGTDLSHDEAEAALIAHYGRLVERCDEDERS